MAYQISKVSNLDFKSALMKLKEEMKKEGFGVLTEIDIKKTLKEKLDVDYEDYVIVGACNPPFAYKALQAEKEIGLMLPCNIIVYTKGNKTIISAIDPVRGMSMIENPQLHEIATKVKEKLGNVVNNV